MNKKLSVALFVVGLMIVAWVAWGFVGTSALALFMTLLIAIVYCAGAYELRQYRQATQSLGEALADVPQPLQDLPAWLQRLHPVLQNPVRLRIEGERVPLPGPALTPYLVGLLVMLGMLGTFLGMVVTFKGAVFALEGSANLTAIRAALAEPIKGLGLSFGTSIAGVATSALLGLISTLSRRERLGVVRELERQLSTVFRPFSAAYQRDQTFQALQVQAQAMPTIVAHLQSLAEQLDRRNEILSQQLIGQQQQFHQEAQAAYQGLAQSVERSLQQALVSSAKQAGETIKPVVESAMAHITQSAQATHAHLANSTQQQWQQLTQQWSDHARGVADNWTQVLSQQSQTQADLLARLDQNLQGFQTAFDARASQWLSSVVSTVAQGQSEQQNQDAERLKAWQASLQTMADQVTQSWQQVSQQTLSQQQAVCQAMEASAGQITERSSAHVADTLAGVTRLLNQSEELVRTRMEAESHWLATQGQRMDQLTAVWQRELGALRDQEAQRGQAAVDRLDALQAAVAQHLGTLGASLEAPMNRMLQTASEVPQAAAQVIAQLREEMTRLSERDTQSVAERTALMSQLADLLQALNTAADQQRGAIDSMVGAASGVLTQAGEQFAQALASQAGKLDDVAAQVAAGAVELASLGQAFGDSVSQFQQSNDKLMDSLHRIEGALSQSMARSDDQLAYYVAQAREVIDLSISSQQGIVEDLRRLHAQVAAGEGAA